MHTHLRIYLLSLSVTLSVSPLVIANPNHENPEAGIAIHDLANSKELASECQKIYETESKAVRSYLELIESEKLSTRNMQSIGKSFVEIERLLRRSNWLGLHGETAGVDYSLRGRVLIGQIRKVRDVCRTVPGAAKIIKNIYVQLQKSAPARLKQLQGVSSLMDAEKWEQAESRFFELWDSLRLTSVLLHTPQQREIETPYHALRTTINKQMMEIRARAASEKLAAARDNQTPDYAALLNEIAVATEAVRSNGSAAVGENQQNGPQLVTTFGRTWKKLHWQALRCRAAEWANCAMQLTNNTEELNQINSAHKKFSSDIITAIAGIIEADATRVSQSDVMQVYQEYLAALVPLVTRSSDDSLANAADGALQKLAAKSPEFANEVVYYANATDELLRWRQRSAEADDRRRELG